ncbi:MAG: formylglycine-generating enzyme family protein [bacterium]|nr:formylglycine-generating enzyme family protein [bacterium]
MQKLILTCALLALLAPALLAQKKEVLVIFEVDLKGLTPKPIQEGVLTDALTAEFADAGNYNLVDRDTLYYYFKQIQEKSQKSCDGPECLADLAAELDADLFVKAEVSKAGEKCAFSAKLYKRKPNTVLYFVDQTKIESCLCQAGDLQKAAHILGRKLSGRKEGKESGVGPGFVSPGLVPSGPAEGGITEVNPTQVVTAASGPAGLYITTSPSGADVYLGNLKTGNTEPAFQKTDLEPGKVVQVTLQKSDFHPLVFPVNLKPGVTKYEGLKLKPNFGTLEIVSEPPGAKVEIGGTQVGTTPYRNERMRSGECLVSVSLDLYDPIKNQVVLVEDEKKTIKNYPLSPNFGTVSLESDPAGAEVFVNNTDQGKTQVFPMVPVKIVNENGEVAHIVDLQTKTPVSIELSPGQYELSLRMDGYHTKSFKLSIASGKQVAITREQGKLVQMVGSLSIFTDPPEPGAKVFIDGIKKGSAPLTLTGIPVGNHEIIVKTKDKEGNKTALIEDQKMASVTIKLEESEEVVRKKEEKVAEEVAKKKYPDMAYIPTGEFMMGCNSSVDNQCGDDGKPYHQVTLDAYYIDKYEVTVAEYQKCVNTLKCDAPKSKSDNQYCNWGYSDRGNHPVNCVDWHDANNYCEWAGKRLPTEAEWEKAARGTDGRKYPWGNETANCDYMVIGYGGNGCGKDSTWPVGSKPKGASPYGVMDMAGNVWEWVSDWYDSGYYGKSPSRNPQGPSSGSSRVIRGGSWNYGTGSLRASGRGSTRWAYRGDNLGFRCVRQIN